MPDRARQCGVSGWPRRAALAGLLVCAALGFTGCASLPEPGPRSVSQALPPSPASSLVQLAIAAAPDPQVSGFPLMATDRMALHTRLELLRRAQHTLDVQAYHIADDETGRALLRLLRDAAERGVRVRLLLDDLYTSGHDELLLGLAAHANLELRLFNPFPAGRGSMLQRFSASLFDFGRVHRRMHNKMLLADGAMAIVGGRNIANDYFMQRAGDNFLDLDALVAGAVLPTLGSLFDSYWNSPHALPIEAIEALALLDAVKREGAFRLRLSADGRGVEWHGIGGDGRAVVLAEPEAGWSRRLLLELIGPFVPEDLL